MATQPSSVEQITSNIPSWMVKYADPLLGQIFGAQDPATGKFVPGLIGQGYQPYAKPKLDAQGKPVLDEKGQPVMEGIQRVAEFTPLQEQAFNRLAGMQVSPELRQAADIARRVGAERNYPAYQAAQERNFYESPQFERMDTSYRDVVARPDTAYQMRGPQYVRPRELEQYQMRGPQDVSAERIAAARMGAPERVAGREYGPLSMGPAERVGIGALQTYQMGPAERVRADQFGLGAAAQYMSPYMQNVVERQKQAAVQDYARNLPALQAAGVKAGARGGTREALLQAEARRNLTSQLGDIEAQGTQAAYQQAQAQYNADRARMLQAQMANQQAGLTTGQQNLAAALGVQQLGTQSGLQAALANQAAGMQVGQQNLAAEQARQQLLSQQALEAQRLNQAAGLTTEQQNLQAQQQAMLANQQYGLQAALANQQAQQRTGEQNLAALLGIQQLGSGQDIQAQLANQAAGMQTEQQNLQALINQSQFGAGQGLQAQQLNQAAQLQRQQQALAQLAQANQFAQQNAQQRAQYGLAGANLAEQSRQFGAGLGLQGLQQQLAAAGALGGLGQQAYGQQMGITQGQLGAGGQQQAQNQQLLNIGYQDFINQQQFPYKQAEFAMGILRGIPTVSSRSFYEQPASIFNQVAGAGMMGIGGLFGGMGQTT